MISRDILVGSWAVPEEVSFKDTIGLICFSMLMKDNMHVANARRNIATKKTWYPTKKLAMISPFSNVTSVGKLLPLSLAFNAILGVHILLFRLLQAESNVKRAHFLKTAADNKSLEQTAENLHRNRKERALERIFTEQTSEHSLNSAVEKYPNYSKKLNEIKDMKTPKYIPDKFIQYCKKAKESEDQKNNTEIEINIIGMEPDMVVEMLKQLDDKDLPVSKFGDDDSSGFGRAKKFMSNSSIGKINEATEHFDPNSIEMDKKDAQLFFISKETKTPAKNHNCGPVHCVPVQKCPVVFPTAARVLSHDEQVHGSQDVCQFAVCGVSFSQQKPDRMHHHIQCVHPVLRRGSPAGQSSANRRRMRQRQAVCPTVVKQLSRRNYHKLSTWQYLGPRGVAD
ncbi:unnamed protein product [Mytilus coruscus]|uniref:Uncharacterized protein n=1 Tax=Mytilus coruscus TaxID=42192 RepID=A0A6J7ZZG0_MYTCO|nr:unnamed protein product [Mytilus coruscus]